MRVKPSATPFPPRPNQRTKRWPDAHWTVGVAAYDWPQAGREYVRGDGKFDAYMAATRLLTAAKEAGYK